MGGKKRNNLDPLYQLFEHHLLTRSYEDAAKFTKALATEYLSYLDSTDAHVPFHTRNFVLEDLESEAKEMLVKKMYGCVRAADYANFGLVMRIGKDESLDSFDFEPQRITEEAQKKSQE